MKWGYREKNSFQSLETAKRYWVIGRRDRGCLPAFAGLFRSYRILGKIRYCPNSTLEDLGQAWFVIAEGAGDG